MRNNLGNARKLLPHDFQTISHMQVVEVCFARRVGEVWHGQKSIHILYRRSRLGQTGVARTVVVVVSAEHDFPFCIPLTGFCRHLSKVPGGESAKDRLPCGFANAHAGRQTFANEEATRRTPDCEEAAMRAAIREEELASV